jgi:hypothetical protein
MWRILRIYLGIEFLLFVVCGARYGLGITLSVLAAFHFLCGLLALALCWRELWGEGEPVETEGLPAPQLPPPSSLLRR